jgi:hypothetical protein
MYDKGGMATDKYKSHAEANSAPLAICRAALKAAELLATTPE